MGGVFPSVSFMFMCVVLLRSGRKLKRARVFFVVFVFSALEDESVVDQFLLFLSSECLQSLFLAGSVEALGCVMRSFVLAGVDGLMFEQGVKQGVEVLFGGGVKRGVTVLVGCWDCWWVRLVDFSVCWLNH